MDPLVFEAYLRPQVWGQRRLASLGKTLPAGQFGESWEISSHAHHVSRVAEGPWAGTPLDRLWSQHAAEILGDAHPPEQFPLLIKYLDCHEQLSVQVHPTDELAHHWLPGERGKTEAWVVLSAGPQARIFAGLNAGVDRPELERHLSAGTVAECLHSFVPQPGDCVFLPAGTVHAVGGGVLMAEVQQSSDATFRLFDWNRLGTDGRPRQLHLEQSLAAINWQTGPVDPVKPTTLSGLPPGIQGAALVRCQYFELRRYRLSNAWPLPAAPRMTIWMLIDGTAELTLSPGDYRRTFHCGETLLLPAGDASALWRPEGSATLLEVRVP